MRGTPSGQTFDDASIPPAGYLFRTSGARTLWLLGDSLTLGTKYDNTNAGGYQSPLNTWIGAHSYTATFLGTQTNAYSGLLHNGMSGYTLAQLLVVATANYTGHVNAADGVIFMGGENDAGSAAYDGAASIATYRQIIQHLQSHNPPGQKSWIFVTTITDRSDGASQARVDDFNSRLAAEWDWIDANRPAGARLLVRCDAFTALGGRFSAPNYDVASGNVHFTDAGYAALAAHFEAQAAAYGLIAP